jgi:outer membrane usher protein
VEVENRFAGRTGSSGKLMVPGLRSFQKNKISIDPANLPLTASVDTTKEVVAPADGGAVVVDFGVSTDVKSAIVKIMKPDGQPMPAGSRGKLADGASFLVGYDGKAFIKGLSDANVATIANDATSCSAAFDYRASGENQVVIGPVVCQ